MDGLDRFVSYGLADGLPGLALQRNALSTAPDGKVVMGTSDGAVSVDPQAAPRGLNAPRTVLSRAWIDGEEITRSLNPARLELDLPHDHRDLMLQFAVLDFHEPERNLARYRLRGYEPDFSELTGNRVARYTNLPPGEYVLEVEGCSSRGVPGEKALEIPIRVATPWWQSPLAWGAMTLLLGGLIWFIIRLRLRALNQSNERLQELVEERTRELESANEQLRARSARDFLTGLLNRRGFTEQFSVVQRLSIRNKSSLSVVLFDLDHFKYINDVHGHDVGDEVLRTVGQILRDSLRGADIAARWGGEEFLLALPDTSAEGAVEVCEKIRIRLGDPKLTSIGPPVKITATFGVVNAKGSDRPLEAWARAADEALYQGKHGGRDQIQIYAGDGL